jgi:hypothetical protein
MAQDRTANKGVNRIPRGYERTRGLLEISKGERPALELKPAQYLHVIREDKYLEDWVVIEAGTIVSVDPSGLLVPCNGFEPQTITYDDNDIGLTVDIDETNDSTYVTVAGASSAAIDGNKPVGVAPYDYYANLNAGFGNAGATKYLNYQIQDKVAILCDYLIEIPVHGDADASGIIVAGDLVQSNTEGKFIKWVDGASDVSQIVGRCIQRADNSTPVDNLDKVQTVPGLGLSGSATQGTPSHLFDYSNDAPYAEKMLIQLMVA